VHDAADDLVENPLSSVDKVQSLGEKRRDARHPTIV
jgi:hypothetical protein